MRREEGWRQRDRETEGGRGQKGEQKTEDLINNRMKRPFQLSNIKTHCGFQLNGGLERARERCNTIDSANSSFSTSEHW